MKKDKKQFLFTYLALFPGYRLLSSLSELTENDKFMIKDHDAILFRVLDGEIVQCDLRGRRKT